MTFRTRLRLISVLAVVVALVASSGVLYVWVRSSLHGRVDRQLRAQGDYLREHASTAQDAQRLPPAAVGGVRSYVQFVSRDGQILPPPAARAGAGPRAPAPAPPPRRIPGGPARPGDPPPRPLAPQGQGYEQPSQSPSVPLQISSTTRAVLSSPRTERFEDQRSADGHLRVLDVGLSDGGVAQIALSLDDTDTTLRDLRIILVAAFGAAVLLAVVLALFVTRFAARPLRRLEQAIDAIGTSQDISVRVPDVSGDEIGRLARRFNDMLDRLSVAREAQLRLVEDASHELRTPLTSIMTNVEVLEEATDLPERHRELVSDVTTQVRELAQLTQSLVELAQGDADESGEETAVDLAVLATDCVERAQRVARARVHVELGHSPRTPGTVWARPARLRSAIDNLLSNAVKFAPDGTRVVLQLDGTRIVVRDEGPGIARHDRRHVFERFYRSASAKNTPGAGLGLSIVQSVVAELGGTIEIIDGIDGRGVGFAVTLPPHAA